MKLKASLICLLTFLISSSHAQVAKPTTSGAKLKAGKYIAAEAIKGYEVLGWGELGPINAKADNNKIFQKTTLPLINAKIDTFRMLEKKQPGFGKNASYSIVHIFNVKQGSEEPVRKVYEFYFDKTLNIVDVYKGTAEDYIQKNNDILADADTKIRLIKEINELRKANGLF